MPGAVQVATAPGPWQKAAELGDFDRARNLKQRHGRLVRTQERSMAAQSPKLGSGILARLLGVNLSGRAGDITCGVTRSRVPRIKTATCDGAL